MLADHLLEQPGGNPATFDAEWRAALASGERRWLSYPAAQPRSQTELFERLKAELVDEILESYGLRQGRVLEYACGSAGMGLYLAGQGFDLTALDLSRSALTLAQRNASQHATPAQRLSLSAGDVFRLPFTDGSFDLVMSYGLLEHFAPEQLPALLAETQRVLRPGGLHLVDIIHGRASVRSLASGLNFCASAALRLARGQPGQIGPLFAAYFEHYYENRLDPAAWAALFAASGLCEVRSYTCRPFPLLALSGPLERAYIGLLQALGPIWRWYDRNQLPGLDRLGWMYLIYGRKPTT